MGSNPVQAWIFSGFIFSSAYVECITATIFYLLKPNQLFQYSFQGFIAACYFFYTSTQDYNLPAARVYVDAGRSLARQYKYRHIEELLSCSGETGQVTDKCHDYIKEY